MIETGHADSGGGGGGGAGGGGAGAAVGRDVASRGVDVLDAVGTLVAAGATVPAAVPPGVEPLDATKSVDAGVALAAASGVGVVSVDDD